MHELGSGFTALSLALLQVLFDLGIGAAAWGLGVVVRRRGEEAHSAASERDTLVEEWASREQAVVDEERRRIARELHDVVGHALAAIALSAGAAEQAGGSSSPDVRRALRVIRSTSQDAAGDVRRLLGMLRTESNHDLRPQPTLADLPELIDGTRTNGMQVRWLVEGDPRPAPVGVQLAAYRIVQEGLTNTARHAPGATVEVALRWEPQALDIEITDDGRDTPLYPDGTGHGLVGVRERVELYGGSFHAGKATGGGFRLSARLPTP